MNREPKRIRISKSISRYYKKKVEKLSIYSSIVKVFIFKGGMPPASASE